jgi:hypothetical protein
MSSPTAATDIVAATVMAFFEVAVISAADGEFGATVAADADTA